MIFGHKSPIKNHLSAKKQTWSHKVMVHGAHDQAFETDIQRQPLPERDPPPKDERPELVHSRQ
jgi:hypothetical protein